MYLSATIALAAAGFRLLPVRMRDARRRRRGGTNDDQERWRTTWGAVGVGMRRL